MKQIYISLLIIVLIIVLSSFTLVKQHDRTVFYTLPKHLSQQVSTETKGLNQMQIIDYALSLTANKLQFSEKNDISHGKANCVGYAQLCSAICNQAFKANGYSCQAKPVVGYIKLNGVNLCDKLKRLMPNKHYRNFVKDHDFVEVTIDGTIYYFDPSIYDILGDKCLTVHKQQPSKN